MSDNSIKTIMDTTMDKLRAMVDADTIIGTPLTVGEITLIPVLQREAVISPVRISSSCSVAAEVQVLL